MKYIATVLLLIFSLSCKNAFNFPKKNNKEAKAAMNTENSPLKKIKLPPGFKIEIFAENIENARSMTLSPDGTLYVGTRDKGDVYAIKDTDGDYKADKVYTLATGLKMPNGVAFKDGDLYIAEVSKISKMVDIENRLNNPPALTTVYDAYPNKSHHGWKYIAFGPDGKLYVPVGAPCNICESDEVFASITRINADGSNMEIIQEGIRNTVGFTWHPDTEELWFTDNGRDMMGDDMPACELNHAPKDGMHFGYPYCHQGDTPDNKFGGKRACSEFTAPAQNLGAHVAPLGLEFCTSQMFPAKYQKQILIAEHGSWNRRKKSGYVISLVNIDENNKATSYTTFAEGWLNKSDDSVWGRPVDLEFLPDGSMLVSDDHADMIYRISYEG